MYYLVCIAARFILALILHPERRYATFKLFYTDETPVDYEPPHFKAADPEKDKWYFMTHDLDEKPDRWSIGKANTGHHSLVLLFLVEAV